MSRSEKVKIANYLRKTEQPILKYLKKRSGKDPKGQAYKKAHTEFKHILQKLHLGFGYDVLERSIKKMDQAQKTWLLRALQHYIVNFALFIGKAGVGFSKDAEFKSLIEQNALAIRALDRALRTALGDATDLDRFARQATFSEQFKIRLGLGDEATETSATAVGAASFASTFVCWYFWDEAYRARVGGEQPTFWAVLGADTGTRGPIHDEIMKISIPALDSVGDYLGMAIDTVCHATQTTIAAGAQVVTDTPGDVVQAAETVKTLGRFNFDFIEHFASLGGLIKEGLKDGIKFILAFLAAASMVVIEFFKKEESYVVTRGAHAKTVAAHSHQGGTQTITTTTTLGKVLHIGLLPLKLFFSVIYSAMLLPSILKGHVKAWRNLWRGRKKARSRGRLLASWGLGLSLAALGFFIPFGASYTALAFGMFGLWAGIKIHTWITRYRARKKHDGCANPEKWHLSSTELNQLVTPVPTQAPSVHAADKPLSPATPRLARVSELNKLPAGNCSLDNVTSTVYLLQCIGEQEKVKSQQIKPHGYLKGTFYWYTNHVLGLYYKDTKQRAGSEKAIKQLKAGEIPAMRQTMDQALHVTYNDDQLSSITNNYVPTGPR